MLTINDQDKEIKSIIKDKHEGKFFIEIEIFQIIDSLQINLNEVKNINTNINDEDTIQKNLFNYLYYSIKEEKYYFNLKRKHTKQRIYHQKLLNSYKKNYKENSNLDKINLDDDI